MAGEGGLKVAELSEQELVQGEELRRRIRNLLGRSLHIRHVDSGSCNGCDFEMSTLTNPVYDVQRFGIDFVASPRHADMLMVTGGVTRHLEEAVQKTYKATAEPKLVLAVGTCACGGGIVGQSYASRGGVDQLLPVTVYIPGCPPRPQALIEGILLAIDRYDHQRKPDKE
jgi:Ni,Fe-hydrogenase III small subunit